MRPVLGVSAHLEEAATKIDADDGTIGHGQEREEHTQHHHGSSKETLLSSSRHADARQGSSRPAEWTADGRESTSRPAPSADSFPMVIAAVLMPQPTKQASERPPCACERMMGPVRCPPKSSPDRTLYTSRVPPGGSLAMPICVNQASPAVKQDETLSASGWCCSTRS